MPVLDLGDMRPERDHLGVAPALLPLHGLGAREIVLVAGVPSRVRTRRVRTRLAVLDLAAPGLAGLRERPLSCDVPKSAGAGVMLIVVLLLPRGAPALG